MNCHACSSQGFITDSPFLGCVTKRITVPVANREQRLDTYLACVDFSVGFQSTGSLMYHIQPIIMYICINTDRCHWQLKIYCQRLSLTVEIGRLKPTVGLNCFRWTLSLWIHTLTRCQINNPNFFLMSYITPMNLNSFCVSVSQLQIMNRSFFCCRSWQAMHQGHGSFEIFKLVTVTGARQWLMHYRTSP